MFKKISIKKLNKST